MIGQWDWKTYVAIGTFGVLIGGLVMERERSMVRLIDGQGALRKMVETAHEDANASDKMISTSITNLAQTTDGIRSRIAAGEQRVSAIDQRLIILETEVGLVKEMMRNKTKGLRD